MALSETTHASLHDLDAELDTYGGSGTDRLKKIAGLANMAVTLRQHARADERPGIDQALHELARKHGVPDDCLLPSPGSGPV